MRYHEKNAFFVEDSARGDFDGVFFASSFLFDKFYYSSTEGARKNASVF